MTPSLRLDECAGHLCPMRRQDQRTARVRRVAWTNALPALAAVSAVCAGADAPRGITVLWSGDDQWVKIERQDDPAAAPNDHPASLDTTAVRNALGALRVRLMDPDTGIESQRAVFTHEEIGNLAPHVAAGLARAGPRQDVTFSTLGSHPLGGGGLIKDMGVNAGRIFYESGRLNVIFGELQANYRKRNVYGRRDEDFKARRTGTRAQATEHKWTLAARPGVEFHASGGGAVRNDWVTIDPAVAGTQAVAVPQPRESQPRPPSPASPPAGGAAPEPVADAATEPATAPAPGAAAGSAAADLERRLQILKDLKDKGLISEEVYNAKVQELLSGL